ncbi:hypothetical protein ACQ4N7_16935 [Nodosilinea sp. AN01ver1]|uniref:hypothetical protein n=1 Tax=Nodosilinea sp. AN01ver1 TaxID=3423362 RepID=UPI003D3191F0
MASTPLSQRLASPSGAASPTTPLSQRSLMEVGRTAMVGAILPIDVAAGFDSAQPASG